MTEGEDEDADVADGQRGDEGKHDVDVEDEVAAAGAAAGAV